LRLQRRALVEQIFAELRMLGGGVIARMLDDALADLEAEIQPAEIGITLLKMLHDAQRMQIVIKRFAVSAHGGVERVLTRVSKRRMADIMDQRERLYQVDIEIEFGGDGAGDLRDFNGVREPVAKVVRVAAGEDLRLILQATK